MTHGIHGEKRWYALIVLCLGVLMIVLDSTIVNVALPSISTDLHFTETALVWVVNAYLLTFGGCLLLGGRLGDLYGQRRMFLAGLVVFTLASLACGLAQSQTMLIAARAVQGLGGAVVSAVALSLIMNLFTEPGERARAMGVYGFVCAGGGSIGVLLGGLLTSSLSWHWIFLVNLPIGIAVYAMCVALLPRLRAPAGTARLDVAGAITVTASLMLAVYGIVGGNEAGWLSMQTVALIGAAVALLALFIAIEARAAHPLMPLTLFAARNVALANVIGVLWAAAMFAWFFLSALYMQRVLGYGPLQVGLAFLPANLIMAAFSLGLSARIVMRFGIRGPIAAGLLIAACGLALFSRAPVDGGFVWHVLPGMTLLGIGAGVAFNPMLLAAMNDVDPADSGLASGIVNTAFMMGGALGLAVLASLAAA
ncbi:DHA2 family efflux MFS transporter permease subunit, partial [Burkholderia sp. LMG 13014]